jgi:membrane protease YdiL (CAAX protease family)
VGVLFWNQTTLAFLSVMVFLVLFFGSYALAFKVLRLLKRKGWSPDVNRGIISSPSTLTTPVRPNEDAAS